MFALAEQCSLYCIEHVLFFGNFCNGVIMCEYEINVTNKEEHSIISIQPMYALTEQYRTCSLIRFFVVIMCEYEINVK